MTPHDPAQPRTLALEAPINCPIYSFLDLQLRALVANGRMEWATAWPLVPIETSGSFQPHSNEGSGRARGGRLNESIRFLGQKQDCRPSDSPRPAPESDQQEPVEAL